MVWRSTGPHSPWHGWSDIGSELSLINFASFFGSLPSFNQLIVDFWFGAGWFGLWSWYPPNNSPLSLKMKGIIGFQTNNPNQQLTVTRWFKPWPFDHLVGVHLAFEFGSRFHSPSQKKGHFAAESPGVLQLWRIFGPNFLFPHFPRPTGGFNKSQVIMCSGGRSEHTDEKSVSRQGNELVVPRMSFGENRGAGKGQCNLLVPRTLHRIGGFQVPYAWLV